MFLKSCYEGKKIQKLGPNKFQVPPLRDCFSGKYAKTADNQHLLF